jgi:hypothetical protein
MQKSAEEVAPIDSAYAQGITVGMRRRLSNPLMRASAVVIIVIGT